MKVLISGSSGFIGKPAVAGLKSEGHEVFRLVRGVAEKEDEISWNIKESKIEIEKLEQVLPDLVIHLAGEPVLGLWTEAKKKEIVESRIKSAGILCNALLKLSKLPRAIISASGISYYGSRADEELDEASTRGNGFLSDCTLDWENSWDDIKAKGVSVFTLRLGVVLNPSGGALAGMRLPFYLGLGGVMGSGKQWLSWISLWDVVRAFLFLVSDINGPRKIAPGPINFVGPKPVQNYEFTKTLGRVMWRPTICWIPEFVLKLGMGQELANETVLMSARVLPRRLLDAGFAFCDNSLEEALRNELYTTVGRVSK
eukprot:Phypoly_transcript_12643.p1 GENE.Phypoly_transcript_12643~~Phypoly_transcript_12643.p1  ORF type:complete len:313 (-),score=44.00 Phypoly_transcript_12643:8-946(-)